MIRDQANGTSPAARAGTGVEVCLRRWQSGSQFHIYVAQDCNLRCAYCFNLHGAFGRAPRQMTLETAQGVTRFIASHHASDAPFLNVRFMGGEPMLGRDALFEIMRGLRSLPGSASKPRFAIDTNGTLLDRQALTFWDSLGCVQLNVSLDGDSAATDANRHTRDGKPTWRRVVRNLRRAQDYRVDLGATAVLTRSNCNAVEVTAELRSLGFRSITLTPVWRSPLNPATAGVEIDADSESYYRASMVGLLAEYFCGLKEAMDQHRPPDYFLSNAFAVLEAAQPPRPDQPARRCGGGALAIDCEGYLLPCAATAHLPEFRVGHISSGIDPAATERFCKARLSTADVEKCRDCWARLRCGGPCLQFVGSAQQLAGLEPVESYCRMRKREIEVGAATLHELERMYDGALPALLGYASEWFGAGPAPHISAGFLQRTG